jgi:hypothetical protein
LDEAVSPAKHFPAEANDLIGMGYMIFIVGGSVKYFV